MYKCIKCGKGFEKDWRKESTIKKYKYASPRFCSLICGHMRIVSDEQKRKVSEKLKGRKGNGFGFKKGYDSRRKLLTKDDWDKAVNIIKEKKAIEYINTSFDKMKITWKKRKILEEQYNKCNKCKINSWNNERIVLELHHKDGNHNNQKRDNLEFLCPNCHSQTHNWKNKNKRRVVRVAKGDCLLNNSLP